MLYDTDMTLDVDDVGALAVLHALADRGEAELLAVAYNEVHADGVAAIDAINTWYGRPLPIGAFEGELANPDASRYLAHLATFPHTASAATAPSALDVYRTVLAEQPDQSVTIVSVGFLNNLAAVLRAERSLAARKVRCLVVMGGLRNDGFNFVRHGLVDVSAFVIENWPTPLVVSDFGGGVQTGARLPMPPRRTRCGKRTFAGSGAPTAAARVGTRSRCCSVCAAPAICSRWSSRARAGCRTATFGTSARTGGRTSSRGTRPAFMSA